MNIYEGVFSFGYNIIQAIMLHALMFSLYVTNKNVPIIEEYMPIDTRKRPKN